MTRWLAAFLLAAPLLAGAQQLLDFRDDLAFRPDTVETLAERVYRERLGALEADGKLDSNRILLERIRRTVARLRPVVEYERSTAATISGKSTSVASATRMPRPWRAESCLSERSSS